MINGTWIGPRRRGLLAALTIGLTAGCGATGTAPQAAPGSSGSQANAAANAKSGQGPRLMFITNSDSDWWNAVHKGMTDGGATFGAQVEMRRNDGTTDKQISLLESVISLPDVKGVAVSVLEAEAPGIADKMRELRKAGKVVITVDSDGPTDTRRAYIGTNNRKAGVVAGKAAAMIRPQGGKAVFFVGTDAAANAVERREGFMTGAGKAFTQAAVFEDGGDVSGRAVRNVENAITKFPDVGVLVGLWSYNAPRIAEEVGKSPELRKKVSVVTFDLDELAVDQIEKGWIDATVCQNPYEMGYQGVRLLKALVEDDTATVTEMLPGEATTIDTGVRVIVPSKDSPVKGDNVIDIKGMKTWLGSKGLKSS